MKKRVSGTAATSKTLSSREPRGSKLCDLLPPQSCRSNGTAANGDADVTGAEIRCLDGA